MQRKFTVLVGAAVAACCAATVYAAGPVAASTHTLTSKATQNKPGSAKHPAPFAATWRYDLVQPDGFRGPPPGSWTWKWNGVQANGAKFPKCTAAMIDAAQSDAGCPKGSLIGTAPFGAKLGPEDDPSSTIDCTGKTLRFYNAGPKAQAWFIVGPPEGCAGLTYLPPLPVTLSTKKGTTTFRLVFPDNITHPLPGVAGALTFADTTWPAARRKVGKKTVTYLSSSSCSSKRTLSFVIVDGEGTHNESADAGSCG